MSLFGSIQLATNSLRATQIGLQVTGQNIANANTPGYIREEVSLTPAPGQRYGELVIGLGVKITGVVQQIDKQVVQRLRNAESDLASSEAQESAYKDLESILGELGSNDLSTGLNDFFSSINDILNQPESVSVRNLAVLRGQTLADRIASLASRTTQLRTDIDEQIQASADAINSQLARIATLNLRISNTENGDTSASDAVGLRDQRLQALTDLGKLVDIQVEEQPDSSVNVLVGGDLMVTGNYHKSVKVATVSDRGQAVSTINIVETDSPLIASSGKVFGLQTARDTILGGYLDEINTFASTLITEFNKAYSTGQGLTGYSQLTSEHAVANTTDALDATGLPSTPVNGSFQILVRNKTTGLTTTSNIQVQLHGLDTDTSLADVAAQINAVSGVSATIAAGKLSITSDANDSEFSFARDNTGLLAALGINTFFAGSDAATIGVNAQLKADPAKFAASHTGIGKDTQGAVELAAFLDKSLDSQNGSSLAILYDRMVSGVAQGSAVATSSADGHRVFAETLLSQHLSVSGVNLDEEAVKLMQFQRVYQASAKYIAALNELLDTLVNL